MMFTSTIIIEIVVGVLCVIAGIALLVNGHNSQQVQATIEGPGERPGAYFIRFERDGKNYRGNYKSRQELEAGSVVTINTSKKQIVPNNWKLGVGLCFGLAALDFIIAGFGILS